MKHLGSGKGIIKIRQCVINDNKGPGIVLNGSCTLDTTLCTIVGNLGGETHDNRKVTIKQLEEVEAPNLETPQNT